MIITSVSGSIPTKRVGMTDVPSSATDEQVLETALVAARETRSSLFGWRVERNVEEGTASVSLYTD